MIAKDPEYRNRKSGAIVHHIRTYGGMVQIQDANKKRNIALTRFERDYEVVAGAQVDLKTPTVFVKPPNYGPNRGSGLAANARQNLTVRGSRRNKLTADDRNEMARVGSVPYCCACGSTNALQVSHSPAGVLGHGGSIKGHPALLARLCVDCHVGIDQHKRPDWLEAWLIAFARTQAAVYDMRVAA